MSENNENPDEQRLEVLRQIPPLMPRFLRRRRAVVPEIQARILELCDRLDIDRSTFFALVQLHELQGGYNWQPITEAQVRARNPYSTIDHLASPVALLKAKGLLLADPEGHLSLSREARQAVDRMHMVARDCVGRLQPLPQDQLQALALQLERALHATLGDPVLMPRPGSHLAGSHSLAVFGPDAPPMVRIEQAIFDLWMARDDAHIRAWREAGLDGPAVEVLSALWLGDARKIPELREKLKGNQTPEELYETLAYLADNDYVVRGADQVVELTPAGALLRQDIERETDRVYFDPWPQSYEEAVRVRDLLGKLVDNLQAPSAHGKLS